jgi:hypothetical protein
MLHRTSLPFFRLLSAVVDILGVLRDPHFPGNRGMVFPDLVSTGGVASQQAQCAPELGLQAKPTLAPTDSYFVLPLQGAFLPSDPHCGARLAGGTTDQGG